MVPKGLSAFALVSHVFSALMRFPALGADGHGYFDWSILIGFSLRLCRVGLDLCINYKYKLSKTANERLSLRSSTSRSIPNMYEERAIEQTNRNNVPLSDKDAAGKLFLETSEIRSLREVRHC